MRHVSVERSLQWREACHCSAHYCPTALFAAQNSILDHPSQNMRASWDWDHWATNYNNCLDLEKSIWCWALNDILLVIVALITWGHHCPSHRTPFFVRSQQKFENIKMATNYNNCLDFTPDTICIKKFESVCETSSQIWLNNTYRKYFRRYTNFKYSILFLTLPTFSHFAVSWLRSDIGIEFGDECGAIFSPYCAGLT